MGRGREGGGTGMHTEAHMHTHSHSLTNEPQLIFILLCPVHPAHTGRNINGH